MRADHASVEALIAVGEASYLVAEMGDGPPVLLLHGFPQTHVCWREVAPALAAAHRVVMPDLRGYGASEAPVGGPRGEGYTKREMAAEVVELMAALGHERFAVIGHDRGARVAYRLALDHPERVTRAALLNVVPTVDQFERMGGGPSLGFWPWAFTSTVSTMRGTAPLAGGSPPPCSSSSARTRPSWPTRPRSGALGRRIWLRPPSPAVTSSQRRHRVRSPSSSAASWRARRTYRTSSLQPPGSRTRGRTRALNATWCSPGGQVRCGARVDEARRKLIGHVENVARASTHP